ncbi:MAG: sulfotransferase [Blastomonas sp.]
MLIRKETILDRATALAGADDFGEPGYLAGLDALIAAIGEDPALNESQRESVEQRLVMPAVKRLHLHQQRKIFPEIAAQRIIAPIIVIGLPRSGTTFLHALLAQDPAARSPLAWQLSDLSSPPRQEDSEIDPRIAAVDAAQAMLPDAFKRMHLVGAKLPDECNAITMLDFLSPNFDAGLDMPSYRKWFIAADARAAYQTHHKVLQHLQAFTHGDHWVLKAPPHMFHMAALLNVYPDARIVFPHRDPAATIPSLTSLISTIRSWTYGNVNRAAVGAAQMEFWATAIERIMDFRSAKNVSGRLFDLSYDDLIAAPMESVAAIYAHFGLDLTPGAESAMRQFLDHRPKDHFGVHRYSLEEAGLSREAVHERFAPYIATYLGADSGRRKG